MIRVTYFIVCLLLGITLVSCIRDEALNAEADILTCTVPGDILKRDPIIENNGSIDGNGRCRFDTSGT